MTVFGFPFRQTSGYVTDAANDTYVLGADTYSTARNSQTFGLAVSGTGRDRSLSVDVRLAGIVFRGTSLDFRVDLPSTGDYNIYLAIGDATSIQVAQTVQFFDDTTEFTSDAFTTAALGAADFVDASGTEHVGSAAWVSSQASIPLTFSTTICRVVVSASTNAVIAYMAYEAAGGGGGSIIPQIMHHRRMMMQ